MKLFLPAIFTSSNNNWNFLHVLSSTSIYLYCCARGNNKTRLAGKYRFIRALRRSCTIQLKISRFIYKERLVANFFLLILDRWGSFPLARTCFYNTYRRSSDNYRTRGSPWWTPWRILIWMRVGFDIIRACAHAVTRRAPAWDSTGWISSLQPPIRSTISGSESSRACSKWKVRNSQHSTKQRRKRNVVAFGGILSRGKCIYKNIT